MRISDWSSDVCSSDLPPAPGFGRAAQFAVRAFLIGRANEEAEPLFGVLPRNLAGDLRVEFLGGVRIGALGRNEARPGRQVERTAGVEDHRAADAALFEPRLGRLDRKGGV